MDKETLSNYGWVVICVLVLCVMLALATPFGQYVAGAVKNTTIGLTNAAQNKANDCGGILNIEAPTFDFAGGSGGGTEEVEFTPEQMNLATNTWEDVQAVVKAGKADEAGWTEGATKAVSINGTEYTATLIGLDHDGENTATFMIMGGLDDRHVMNSTGTSSGGWEASEMRSYLNNDIYNNIDIKDSIKQVTRITNNKGYQGTTSDLSETQDYLFLLSATEVNLNSPYDVEGEGYLYEYFKTNPFKPICDAWVRSPSTRSYSGFYTVTSIGRYNNISAEISYLVCPAFVIG